MRPWPHTGCLTKKTDVWLIDMMEVQPGMGGGSRLGGSVGVWWRDGAKKRKSWTRTTLWWLLGGEGWGEVREGMGDKWWWTKTLLGKVKCSTEYRCMLWNCVPETCIILFACVTPINSIKRKKKKESSASHAINCFSLIKLSKIKGTNAPCRKALGGRYAACVLWQCDCTKTFWRIMGR